MLRSGLGKRNPQSVSPLTNISLDLRNYPHGGGIRIGGIRIGGPHAKDTNVCVGPNGRLPSRRDGRLAPRDRPLRRTSMVFMSLPRGASATALIGGLEGSPTGGPSALCAIAASAKSAPNSYMAREPNASSDIPPESKAAMARTTLNGQSGQIKMSQPGQRVRHDPSRSASSYEWTDK